MICMMDSAATKFSVLQKETAADRVLQGWTVIFI
jgi:hypothetical protein